VFNFFSKQSTIPTTLVCDMHSHLIPGIDDGVKSIEEATNVIDQLLELGYRKFVTTPHIMTDYFGNTSVSIRAAYDQFLPELRQRGYDMPFECAAEYYMDEAVIVAVDRKEKLLTFGDNHVLFETNVISEPMQMKEFIFAMTMQGYKPILAHPERYQYMSIEKAEDFRNRGVLLQINLLSLIGAYGPIIQRLAEKMISKGLVDVLGTDCHHLDHAQLLRKAFRSTAYRKALDLPLLNFTL
jgi:tyrosine-protein phosphatase YwqE